MSLAADELEQRVAPLRERLLSATAEGLRVLPVGGRTKPALSTPPDGAVALDTTALRGIVEYDPRELTVTALAGTPVAEVRDALAAHGQHLPFDPPLTAAGATLGGVVATGAAGPGAFGHGGVRDFVIGVRFLDGNGTLVGGGGKVVKNAAGFDLPKLLVGSAGRLGVIVQLAFKVFPQPSARTTAVLELERLDAALAAMAALGRGPLGIEALDLEPPGRLLVRLTGPRETLAARVETIAGTRPQLLEDEEERATWERAAELRWLPAGGDLLRVPLTPRAIPAFDAALATTGATVRYSLGGNVAWVAWPSAAPLELPDPLAALLRAQGLAAQRFTGPPGPSLLGTAPGAHAFAQRVRAAIDPAGRFLED